MEKSLELKNLKSCPSIIQINEVIKIVKLIEEPKPYLANLWLDVYNIHNSFSIQIENIKKSGSELNNQEINQMLDYFNIHLNKALMTTKKLDIILGLIFDKNFLVEDATSDERCDSAVLYEASLRLLIEIDSLIIDEKFMNNLFELAKKTPNFYLSSYWLKCESLWRELCIAIRKYKKSPTEKLMNEYLNIYINYKKEIKIIVNAITDVYVFMTNALGKIMYGYPVEHFKSTKPIIINEPEKTNEPSDSNELSDSVDSKKTEKSDDLIDKVKINIKNKIKNKKKKDKRVLYIKADKSANKAAKAFKVIFETIYQDAPDEIIMYACIVFLHELEKASAYNFKANQLWGIAYMSLIEAFGKNPSPEMLKDAIIQVQNNSTTDNKIISVCQNIVAAMKETQQENWCVYK
jgi:hypothetical protein